MNKKTFLIIGIFFLLFLGGCSKMSYVPIITTEYINTSVCYNCTNQFDQSLNTTDNVRFNTTKVGNNSHYWESGIFKLPGGYGSYPSLVGISSDIIGDIGIMNTFFILNLSPVNPALSAPCIGFAYTDISADNRICLQNDSDLTLSADLDLNQLLFEDILAFSHDGLGNLISWMNLEMPNGAKIYFDNGDIDSIGAPDGNGGLITIAINTIPIVNITADGVNINNSLIITGELEGSKETLQFTRGTLTTSAYSGMAGVSANQIIGYV